MGFIYKKRCIKGIDWLLCCCCWNLMGFLWNILSNCNLIRSLIVYWNASKFYGVLREIYCRWTVWGRTIMSKSINIKSKIPISQLHFPLITQMNASIFSSRRHYEALKGKNDSLIAFAVCFNINYLWKIHYLCDLTPRVLRHF